MMRLQNAHGRHRAARGFTLIELLVVIGIIALLISILLPTLSRARGSARRVGCAAFLRQLGMVNQMYMNSFRDWNLPAHWGWSQAAPGWPTQPNPPVAPSGPSMDWPRCTFVGKSFGGAKDSAFAYNGRYSAGLICPDATVANESGTAGSTGGYPIWLAIGANTTQMPGYPASLAPDYWNAWKRAQVHSPTDKIQFCDAVASVDAAGLGNSTLLYFKTGYGEINAPGKAHVVAYRHLRGANALYFDGHVQWKLEGDLRYDPNTPGTAANERQWEPATR